MRTFFTIRLTGIFALSMTEDDSKDTSRMLSARVNRQGKWPISTRLRAGAKRTEIANRPTTVVSLTPLT